MIVCVLNTKPFENRGTKLEYTTDHVYRLKEQCEKHSSHGFACLSDVDVPGVYTVKLLNDWPGWFAKIELFHHFRGKYFYMDLDTVITGDLDPLIDYPHEFTALGPLSGPHKINSSVLAWNGDYSHLYKKFKANAQENMKLYMTDEKWSDQAFIADNQKFAKLQEIFPNSVKSYVYDLEYGKIPRHSDTKIVCFNGQPKPWQTDYRG
jgi:hypothetical protein